MKKINKMIIMLFCLFLLVGCKDTEAMKQEKYQENKTLEQEKKEMTKEQEEIFRSYGLKGSEISRMKEEGMIMGKHLMFFIRGKKVVPMGILTF